jgi:hypothetical protein
MNRRRFIKLLSFLPLFGLIKPAESKVLVDSVKVTKFETDLNSNDFTFEAWYHPDTQWIHYAEVHCNGKITRYIDGEKCI